MNRRQRRRSRTYDHEITLIGEKITYDELKNPITEKTETKVLCDVDSVGSNEFYQASAEGLKPSVTFVIHAFEYSDEQRIAYKDEDDLYKVIRTYANDYEEIEITCEKVVRDG